LVPSIIFVAVRDALARFFSARFQRLPIGVSQSILGWQLLNIYCLRTIN
jgi:hypothetical protein